MAVKKPKRVGAYVVEGVLGKGGMGEVYKAHHELLDRTVALKRLTAPDEADKKEHFEERFRREGKALAKLHHQGIVDVYDLFTWRNHYYMAIEFVEGFDCLELLKKSSFFPVDVACLIALRMSEALEHAHFQRIVHRDGKFPPVHKVQPGIPRPLRKIVARTLHKNPEKRFQSASDLRAALDRFLTTHGAWTNGNERLVAFLNAEGVISDDEARTVIDADDLILSKDVALISPYRTRNRAVGFGLTIMVVLLIVGWRGGFFAKFADALSSAFGATL